VTTKAKISRMSARKGPNCKVCVSPHRAAVDNALLTGMPTTKVAVQFGFTQSSVSRHKLNHLKAQAQQIANAVLPMVLPPQPLPTTILPSMESMLGKLGSTIDRAETLVADAEREGGIAVRAVSITALKGALVDTAKLLAMLGPQGPKDVTPEQIDRSALADLFASADVDSKEVILERLLP
jgi:hypothetical protein